jgi:hypothetical protein
MQFDCRYLFRASGFFLLAAFVSLFAIGEVYAGAKDELSGANGEAVPLQRVMRNERAKGPIFVAIPEAYVFGLGGDRNLTYCSPSIRATNSSNAVVEELIVGVEYRNSAGQLAGRSVSRFNNIKIQQQNVHYFNQLESISCKGLEGAMTVVRCLYSTGEDCSKDIQVVAFGAIRLHLKPR